jgi:general secretion pathway protein G
MMCILSVRKLQLMVRPIVNGKTNNMPPFFLKYRLKCAGFTMIELMVVMTITALLLSVAYPSYMKHVQYSKEAILQQDLSVMRDAIDKFYADLGRYPIDLEELVSKQYIRNIPKDPITEDRNTWQLIAPEDGETGVFDVKSSAPGQASNGSDFVDW